MRANDTSDASSMSTLPEAAAALVPEQDHAASSKQQENEDGEERKRGRDAGAGSASNETPATKKFKRRTVEWRILPQDVFPPVKVQLDVDDDVEDDGDDDIHNNTAHADATLRYSAVVESMQCGASYADHIEDVVALNDVFVSTVGSRVDKVELSVVQEIEKGISNFPHEVLPAHEAAWLRKTQQSSIDAASENFEVCQDVESVADSKAKTDIDLEKMYGCMGAQLQSELADDDGSGTGVPEVLSLQVGVTFPSMKVAEHSVRLHSHAAMKVVPGHSTSCKIWFCADT